MARQVIVLGSINTDLVVKVTRLPRPGETVIGGTFYKNQGGKGANQAVAAARAGTTPVIFVAALGDDAFGRESRHLLAVENINLHFIQEKPGIPSGVALIMVDDRGENAIAVASGANALLSPFDVERLPDELFVPGNVFLTCLEIPCATVEAGLRRAKGQGVFTILNPAPASETLSGELLSQVDLITPNEHEASQLTGVDVHDDTGVEQAARKLLNMGVKHVIITRGSRGCDYFNHSESRHIPAFNVEPVDTTGAGDAFNGALAVAILEGRQWIDCLRWASAAAAISVTRKGAQPSLPRRGEIEEFLNAQD